MPQKTPEERAAYQREYRAKNREKAAEYQRQYNEQNAERLKQYRKEYYQRNRERLLAREAERYRESAELRAKKSARAKRWAKENPEEYKARQKKSWVKLKYGLTVEEYDSIMAQGCAICGIKEGEKQMGRKKILCLDHDHSNGQIRDALCHECNVAIGSMGDDPSRLRAAARYLEKHRKE